MNIPIIVSEDHLVFPGMSLQVRSPADSGATFFSQTQDNPSEGKFIVYYINPGVAPLKSIEYLSSLSPEQLAEEVFVLCKIDSTEVLHNKSCALKVSALKKVTIGQCYEKGSLLITDSFKDVVIQQDLSHEEEMGMRNLLLKTLHSDDYASRHLVKDLAHDVPTEDIVSAICLAENRDSSSFSVRSLHKILVAKSTKTMLTATIELLKVISLVNSYESSIDTSLRNQVDSNQREFYLKERLKVISKELNKSQPASDTLQAKADALELSEEARDKVNNEIERLASLHPSSPEWDNTRHYINCVLSLPWNNDYTRPDIDLKEVKTALDKNHFGLEKVKDRLLDRIAVISRQIKVTGSPRGSVICLIGGPGVGKTSIAHSLAAAFKRKVVHISLAGVRDEHEIRGHRRTYISSSMGIIMSKLQQAGTSEVVMILDEIDKLSMDTMRGNPAAALLEVLDPVQNHMYRDHYLDIGFDLSKVIFVTTANSYDIYAPLLDRMEPIEVQGYNRIEKYQIARNFILPKILESIALSNKEINVTATALQTIVDEYSPESGVRSLERHIRRVIEKTYRGMLSSQKTKATINKSDIKTLLHDEHSFQEPKLKVADRIGVVNCLSYVENMSVGSLTPVEVVTRKQNSKTMSDGSTTLVVSGNLGKVMEESARLATIVASKYNAACLERNTYIHFLSGATPKDGPSAGMAICSAVISSVCSKPIKSTIAMTGEISLVGKILPVGGIPEKIRAAIMSGVKDIILPKRNKKDIDKMDKKELGTTRFYYVETMDETCSILFQNLESA